MGGVTDRIGDVPRRTDHRVPGRSRCDAAALGNHEFDNGFAELQRLRDGGCHPEDGCRFTESYEGAKFPFLGANVTNTDGSPAALPFDISYVEGIPVGAIGVLPRNTPEYIRGDAIENLNFGDEIEAVNRTADTLDALGIRSIILLYKGDIAAGSEADPCSLDNGRAKEVTTTVSPHVDLIVTSDGDGQFNCSYPDPAGRQRTVLQAPRTGGSSLSPISRSTGRPATSCATGLSRSTR